MGAFYCIMNIFVARNTNLFFMNDVASILLRMALSYGLTEREAFINKVSEVLQHVMTDEAQTEKIGEFLVAQMAEFKEQLTAEQIAANAFARSGKGSSKEIKELTEAIRQLTETLNKKQND